MIVLRNKDELEQWRQYACAALAGLARAPHSATYTASLAGEFADKMMKEERERFRDFAALRVKD